MGKFKVVQGKWIDVLYPDAIKVDCNGKCVIDLSLLSMAIGEFDNVRSVSSASNPVLVTDDIILASGSGNAVSVVLPTAVGITGKVYTIKATDITNAVTINTTGGQTIDGLASITFLDTDDVYSVISTGTGWEIIGQIEGLNNTNFTALLDNTVNNVQELADYLDNRFVYLNNTLTINVTNSATLLAAIDSLRKKWYFEPDLFTSDTNVEIILATGTYALGHLLVEDVFTDGRVLIKLKSATGVDADVVLGYDSITLSNGSWDFENVTLKPNLNAFINTHGGTIVVGENTKALFVSCTFDATNFAAQVYTTFQAFITGTGVVRILDPVITNNVVTALSLVYAGTGSNMTIFGTATGTVRNTGITTESGFISIPHFSVVSGLTATIRSPVVWEGGQIAINGGTYPRLTAGEITALATLLGTIEVGYGVYNLTTNKVEIWDGASWNALW